MALQVLWGSTMKIRNALITLSAVLVLFPALIIGTWTYNQSIESQFDQVRERHLLLAKNLGGALERYYLDTKLIFEGIAQNLINGLDHESATPMLSNMGFHDIALVETATAKIIYCLAAYKGPTPEKMNLRMMKVARHLAVEGKTVYSPVMAAPDGTNVILLIRKFGDKLVIGKLRTDYFVAMGKNISFGEKGHAAIVDQAGNVLAHPMDDWITKRKNISKVSAVKRMMNRETGIEKFYSPALKGDMIAGFTHVPGVGWGVMIPQPVSELYAKSSNIIESYLLIVALSFAFAILLAVWFSFRSTKPLATLISAKQSVQNPEQQKTLIVPDNITVPTEIKQLFVTHNDMIDRLHAKHSDVLRMAYSDMVTGLPSREAFNQLVENELNAGKQSAGLKEPDYLLVFLDLDDFKAINDTMGHEVGDTVLSIISKQIADAIANYTDLDVITCPLNKSGNPIQKLNGRAVISRIGGDEFVAFIPWEEGEAGVKDFLQSLNISISSPFIVSDRELSIKSSVGSSLFSRDGSNIRELTKKADIAMYWAKQSGKNCYRLYDESVGDQTPAELQRDVANAIRNNEMVLHYQPKIDIAAGEANSVEAVVRWLHPEKGMISPGLFIPAIDDSETADLLGEWVIRTACEQIREWNIAGRNITISVNIANHHLVSNNFLPNLLRIVDEIGIEPAYLEIEMTEETAMTAHKRAKSVIKALNENGFTVSLDDYGKGYSNLARLAALEIDIIKLDMSLINGITEDPRRAIIVASALDMARNLNCKTVAEGIETQEQATFISRMGCDYLQGYLFAKPMPVDELNTWFLKRLAANNSPRQSQHYDNVVQLAG